MKTLSDYINALYVSEFNEFKQAVLNKLHYTYAQWSDRRTGRTPLKLYELEAINEIYNSFLERRKNKLDKDKLDNLLVHDSTEATIRDIDSKIL